MERMLEDGFSGSGLARAMALAQGGSGLVMSPREPVRVCTWLTTFFMPKKA